MKELKIYLRSEIEKSEQEKDGLYKIRGKFINAGTVDRAWFKLEITDDALKKAFASATKQGKIHAKYMHQEDEIIGHASNFVLEEGFIKGDYFINPKVQRASETIALIEGKTLDAFSIGFSITDFITQDKDGEETLIVNDFKINEISVVDIPAVNQARIEEELRMTFNKEEKWEAKLEKEKEASSLDVSFKKEAIFEQIEAFQKLGETFGVDNKMCLDAAKKGLTIEAFKAEILELKTEEFKKREAKLKADEEAIKAKQKEVDEAFAKVNQNFAATLKKDEMPIGDASKIDEEAKFSSIDKQVELLKKEKKWA